MDKNSFWQCRHALVFVVGFLQKSGPIPNASYALNTSQVPCRVAISVCWICQKDLNSGQTGKRDENFRSPSSCSVHTGIISTEITSADVELPIRKYVRIRHETLKAKKPLQISMFAQIPIHLRPIPLFADCQMVTNGVKAKWFIVHLVTQKL